MSGVRRWYIYLVSLVSLQAVTWAVIALLRNLFVIVTGRDALSWQIAIIVVALPLFLAHWLWGQRLAQQDEAERTSWLRGLYLYGVMATFLGPMVANGFALLRAFFELISGVDSSRFQSPQLSPADSLLYHLLAIVVLALLWFYHQRLTTSEMGRTAERNITLTFRRFYLFGFSAAGLTMATLAVINLLQWLLFQFGAETISSQGRPLVELARLFVGLLLWLLFWQRGQQLFSRGQATEVASTMRKFYLYGVIFVMALTAVSNATAILAGIIRKWLALPSVGDVRDPIAVIVVTAVLWVYHAQVLRQDILVADERPKQAQIRRLYWYLIAAIGLAAFLVGLGGDLSLLIRSLGGATFITGMREQLAWFTAALLAGLPVWLWPWRQAQTEATTPDTAGEAERQSIIRKIYLYFYLFVATMTVLSGAVYIVYNLVSLLLVTDRSFDFTELAQAIAYMLIAAGVWLYHGAALRGDGRLTMLPTQPDSYHVVILTGEDGRLGQSLIQALQQALPFADVQSVGLTAAATPAMMGAPTNGHTPEALLSQAELIIGPWTMTRADAAGQLAAAVVNSPARKLLIPVPQEGWEWAGVEPWDDDTIIQQTIQAARQIALGTAVIPEQSHSIGTIIGIVAGVVGLFIVMIILLSFLAQYLF